MWWQAADGRQGIALIAESAKVAGPVTPPAHALGAANVIGTAERKEDPGVEPHINNFFAPSMPPLMGEAKFAVSLPLPSAPSATETVVSRQTSGPNTQGTPASQARSAKVGSENDRDRSGDEFVAVGACLLQGYRCGL